MTDEPVNAAASPEHYIAILQHEADTTADHLTQVTKLAQALIELIHQQHPWAAADPDTAQHIHYLTNTLPNYTRNRLNQLNEQISNIENQT